MATLAGSVGAHCLQTVQHVGDPRGTVEQIAGVNTYVARPASGGGDKIILFFADVFGALYVNSKLLMDYWAENGEQGGLVDGVRSAYHWGWVLGAGYLVLALDYFEGDSYGFHLDEKGFDTQAWIKKNQARTEVLLPPWIDAVREQYGE